MLINNNNKILPYLKCYWNLYALLPLSGLGLILNYLSGGEIELVWLVKIPQVALLLLLIVFHMRFKVRLTPISFLFLIGCLSASVVGIIRGTFHSPGVKIHLFMTIMPILAISFGKSVAELPKTLVDQIVNAAVKKIFVLSTLVLSIYIYLHFFTQQIAYFGFDSYLPIAASWYLSQSRYVMLAISLILLLLSGKRAPLIAFLPAMISSIWQSLFSYRANRCIYIICLFLLLILTLFLAGNLGLLERYEKIFSMDIADPYDVYLATSGRSSEILGFLMSRDASPILWLTGGGYGDGFDIFAGSETLEMKDKPHYYLHLAMLSYSLVFGLPFVLILLYMITAVLFNSFKQVSHFYVLGALTIFTWSLFGAGMLIEPMFWFFIGVCSSFSKHRALK